MFYFILTTSNKHVGLACSSSWWHFKISVYQELAQEVLWGWRGSRFRAFQEKGAHFCFLLCCPPSSASLPSCKNRKEARLGVLSELLAASRSLELAGWALAWKWWVPDSRRPFRKEKTGKTQWITKITQWSQVWNGTSASFFIDGCSEAGCGGRERVPGVWPAGGTGAKWQAFWHTALTKRPLQRLLREGSWPLCGLSNYSV